MAKRGSKDNCYFVVFVFIWAKLNFILDLILKNLCCKNTVN
jgi:hypothetical protein